MSLSNQACDAVNPAHYRNQPVECIEFTRHMNFSLGNAFKYVWRFAEKNGREDLEKALWYLREQEQTQKAGGIRPVIFPAIRQELLDKLNRCAFTSEAHADALKGVLLSAGGVFPVKSAYIVVRELLKGLSDGAAES